MAKVPDADKLGAAAVADMIEHAQRFSTLRGDIERRLACKDNVSALSDGVNELKRTGRMERQAVKELEGSVELDRERGGTKARGGAPTRTTAYAPDRG